jgi:hypothetical protein
MNEQEFFDLAMKVIGGQATGAERTELEAALASQPDLRAEFARLQADVRLAREVLPFVNASEAAAPELPAYARGRLQTKVRETFGQPQDGSQRARQNERGLLWRWRWVLGLVGVAAVIALVLIPHLSQPNSPVIQVALLDTAGAARGPDTDDAALLRQAWPAAPVETFSATGALTTWETKWPASSKTPVVKIVFDRAAGEVRVLGRQHGKSFEKTFVLLQDLGKTMKEVEVFVRESTRR